MTKLMEHAQKMVAMSKKITDYIKVKKGEVTDDEVHHSFYLSILIFELIFELLLLNLLLIFISFYWFC